MEEKELNEVVTNELPEETVQPIVETPQINESVEIVNQVPQTPEIIETVPTPVPPVVNEIKTSGTATEEEIIIDASKPTAEVLDEYEIKRDVLQEEKKYKKNLTFIIIVIVLIIAFIVLMPFIVKKIGF